MVAYSFKERFVEPILSGRKRQTIRADSKRHAKPGEELQLYVGMRTRKCRLIARATCMVTVPVMIRFVRTGIGGIWLDSEPVSDLDFFAQLDGFADADAMASFWLCEHGPMHGFEGTLIRWHADLRGGEYGARNG